MTMLGSKITDLTWMTFMRVSGETSLEVARGSSASSGCWAYARLLGSLVLF